MSDEPQPQRKSQGWAPREPEHRSVPRRAPGAGPSGTGSSGDTVGRSGAPSGRDADGSTGPTAPRRGKGAGDSNGKDRGNGQAGGPAGGTAGGRASAGGQAAAAGHEPGDGPTAGPRAGHGPGNGPAAGPGAGHGPGNGPARGASAEGDAAATPAAEGTASRRAAAPDRGTTDGAPAQGSPATAKASGAASPAQGAAGRQDGNAGGDGQEAADNPTTVLARITEAGAAPETDNPTTALARIPASAAGQRDNPTTVLARVPAPAAPAPAPAAAAAGAASAPLSKKEARKAKKAARKHTGWRRLIPTWRMVLGTFLFGALLLIGLFVLGYNLVHIPAANAAAVKQSNVYLYADGSQLARDGEVNRENVTLAQISKDAQHAVLAAEDRDFYGEPAIDPKAMIRAAWNTATGKGKQSGSTITQQYVKNYYLGQEQTVSRKAKEFFIAIKLDREKSKDEILEGYLNTSFFGRNAYGIQAAAQAYYGMDADRLTAAQGAYLASLLNAPSSFDVVAHPENKSAALARWNYVLDGMVAEGWLTKAEQAGLEFPEPRQQVIAAGMSGQRGYLVEAVKQYLYENKIIDEDTLRAGGYRITTTLQKKKQNAFVKAVDDKVMDRLDKKNRKIDNSVRVGGVSIDPKTGKVLAMYGGIDFTKQYYNNATRRDYQVGSTFKPFVFTAAVQNDSATQDGTTITPNTYYDGTNKRPVQGWSGGAYAPENEDQVDYGDITVREATDKSVNSVYAQMAVDVGPQRVKQTAIDLGLPENTPDLQPYPSIALGTATASVLDMAEAYSTLANHGKHGTYTLVAKITKDGEPMSLPERNVQQAVTREAADTTTKVLQSVVQSGTATAAQAAGRPAAGKTGTAEEDKAAWFAGYTPDLATVVAVMGQDPKTGVHKPLYGAMGLPRINGGGAPAEIWAQFTKTALKGKPVKQFDLELQEGADVIQRPPTNPSDDPSSSGDEDEGTTRGEENGGQTPGGDTEGTGGTPGADGGATTGGGIDGGAATGGSTGTDGGAATEGGTGSDSGAGTGGTAGPGGGDATGGTTDGGPVGTTLGAFSQSARWEWD